MPSAANRGGEAGQVKVAGFQGQRVYVNDRKVPSEGGQGRGKCVDECYDHEMWVNETNSRAEDSQWRC